MEGDAAASRSVAPVETTGLPVPVGSKQFVDAFDAAWTAYRRASHDERLQTLFYLLEFSLGDDDEHVGERAAVYRAAWQEDPYVDHVRQGSMFSLLERTFPDMYTPELTNEALAECGRHMMYDDEHDRLNAMEFPRMVYRGGGGCEDDVRKGRSWTFDIETAVFFAEKCPKRHGNPCEPILLQMQIDRAEVMAYLCDRGEEEVILTGGQGTDRTRCVRLHEVD
jgi:hypothetical protein